MTHRIYDMLAVALLAITPFLAACHDAARSPTELIEPPPPSPATRNAILGAEHGTELPDCIPFNPQRTKLSIGYDAKEDVVFRLSLAGFDVITSDTARAGTSRVTNVAFGADPDETSPGVLTSITIQMYDVGLNRLLDERVFRHLSIAIPCGPPRNAILGTEDGTQFPNCIPLYPDDTILSIGYDAIEDVKFRFRVNGQHSITSDTAGAGMSRVENVTVYADRYEGAEVRTSMEIKMYDVGLNRLLDERVFGDLTIAIPCD